MVAAGPPSRKTALRERWTVTLYKIAGDHYLFDLDSVTADLDVINPGSVMLSGVMMFDFLGWKEAARLIESSMEKTIGDLKLKKTESELQALRAGRLNALYPCHLKKAQKLLL